MRGRWSICILLVLSTATPLMASDAVQIPDVLSEEIAKFHDLVSSRAPQYRIEAAQIAHQLRLQTFEPGLMGLLKDEDAVVRREAVQALVSCGSSQCVPSLIALLDDPDWGVREHAQMALRQMTGQVSDWRTTAEWERWWNGTTLDEKQGLLLKDLASPDAEARERAARALRCLATPALEDKILKLLADANAVQGKERTFLTETLDRIGGPKSVPYFLEKAGAGDGAAAWALGQRGGKAAEEALLKGFQRNRSMDFMLNLDRLHSAQCGPHLRFLCGNFHSVIHAGKGEDIRYPVSPLRRVSANLIRRSGKGPMLVDLIVSELEGKPKEEAIPEDLKPMFCELRKILTPEFIREGFSQCDPLLGALYDVADDPAIASRLIPLLRSKCLLTRIYAALTLGRLRSKEAVVPIVEVIKEGYTFSDVTSATSAKHTGTFVEVEGRKERQSQTVRWLGYFCVALGEIGTDEARKGLQVLATAPESPRDVRYGSVVALGAIGSPQSLPVLRTVADKDIIWIIRDTAKRTILDIEISQK